MTRSRRKKGGKGLIATLVVIAVFAIVAAVTNPKLAAHDSAVRQTILASVNQNLKDNNLSNPIVSMIGGFAVDKLADAFLSTNMQYHDYLLFSTCTFPTSEGDKVISVGAFGKVFTFDKDDLEKAIKDKVKL